MIISFCISEELYDKTEQAEYAISKMNNNDPDYTYNVSSIDVLARQM